MEYKDIKTPEELLKFMDRIEYGFVSPDNQKYGAWNEAEFEENVTTKWYLSSPERLLKVGYGHCFDQVELERDWFTKHNYNCKTYYLMFLFDEPNDYSTHTFLTYEEDGLWKIFEHADYFNRGIHPFRSLEEALNYEMNHHIEENKKYNKIDAEIIKHLHIFEYEKIKEGTSFDDFVTEILQNGQDRTPKQKTYE